MTTKRTPIGIQNGIKIYTRLKRTPLKRSQKPIRKMSEHKAKDGKQYTKVRKVYLSDYPICEVKGCLNNSSEIHHKKGRIGALLNDTEHFLAVCRGCHIKIEMNPGLAKENNYSVTR